MWVNHVIAENKFSPTPNFKSIKTLAVLLVQYPAFTSLAYLHSSDFCRCRHITAYEYLFQDLHATLPLVYMAKLYACSFTVDGRFQKAEAI